MIAPVRCAVVGYGPQHNFGWAHATWIQATPELKLVAICDVEPDRIVAAARQFPGVRTSVDPAQIFADPGIDLVSIVTPHFTHCALALAAFAAGKHVVVEKAMCLNVAEATAMVEASEAAGRMLAVHHNRRHDGNFRAIKDIVDKGVLGEIFHMEVPAGSFAPPNAKGWYTDKALSGGGFFYWGPHAVDWVLDLVPSRVTGVTGFFHKRLWHDVSNEDQSRAIIAFENGCVADVLWSQIDAAPRPAWRILGSKGGLVDTGRGGNVGYERQIAGPSGGSLKLIECVGAIRRESDVAYMESNWGVYWQDVADHLLRGGPVPVSGHFGRRVIGILETAERSSQSGKTEPVPYESGS